MTYQFLIENETMNNITTYIPEHLRKNYDTKGWYLCTVDINQKEKHVIETEESTVELFIDVKKSLSHRDTHANIGTITHTAGDCQFKVGDQLMVKHFCFENSSRKKNVFHVDAETRTEYYKVDIRDVMFGIIDGELVPRMGVLLCEKVYPKDFNDSLFNITELKGSRRDIAKVLRVWDGCTDIEVGDYVLLANGGDYIFTHKGTEFIKSDVYGNDVLSVVKSTDWEIKEERKHAKHEHNFKWK